MAVLLFFFLSFFFFVFSCNSGRMCSWVVNLNFVKRWDLPILSSHSTRLLIHSGKMKYLSIGFEALDPHLWIICLAYDDYSTILYEGVFWSSLWSIRCFPILILVCVLGSYVLEFACYIEAKSSFQGFQVLMLMFFNMCVSVCVCWGRVYIVMAWVYMWLSGQHVGVCSLYLMRSMDQTSIIRSGIQVLVSSIVPVQAF